MSELKDVLRTAQTAIARAIDIVLLTDPDTPPAPPPPPPAPPSPPPAPAPTVTLETLVIPNMAQLIALEAYYRMSSSYDRAQQPFFLRGTSMQIPIVGLDGAIVARRNLPLGDYTLTAKPLGGTSTPLGTLTVSTATPRAIFTANLLGLDTAKSHLLELVGPAGWTFLLGWANFAGGGAPTVPLTRANYDFLHDRKPYQYGLVSADAKPTIRPLPAGDYPPLPVITSQYQLRRDSLIPWTEYDYYSLRMTPDGLTTVNAQEYNYSELINEKPQYPLTDSNVAFVTHLRVSHTGGAWFSDPWRMGHAGPDRKVRTLVGWEDLPDGTRVLRGDWTGVLGPKGVWEAWQFDFVPSTLEIDLAAPPVIINGQPFQPHKRNPVFYWVDTRHNRVLRGEGNKNDPTAPVIVTEFLAGLNDPFGLIVDPTDEAIIVAERLGNRIRAFDAAGLMVEVIASSNVPLLMSAEGRFTSLAGITLANARLAQIAGPEGLAYMDGKIYAGSLVLRQVRSFRRGGGGVPTIEIAECRLDGNARFCSPCVSDGTFLPRGKVLYNGWSSELAGLPLGWDFNWVNSFEMGNRPMDTLWYSSAAAIGRGRMHIGGASGGIVTLSAKRATDTTITVDAWRTMRTAWAAAGHDIRHGDEPNGQFGLPLPWGEGHDPYLLAHGLVKETP
jgi:hypothetical protein